MQSSFWPRLSEARHFLPLLRGHLVASAAAFPLSAGLTLDLLPIVEDGLFGYELVPDRDAQTYLTVGRNARGNMVLRRTLYGDGAPNALQLVAVDGQLLSRSERAARYRLQQRDTCFLDPAAAADATFAQLLTLFPQRPRLPIGIREHWHRSLDGALAIAHSHLARWHPIIRFCGIPDEAQHGFALSGAPGEHGELIFQRPDIWMLRWKAAPHAVYESWSVPVPLPEVPDAVARGDAAS